MTRVLVARLSAMGDVVHCLGAVEALASARPDLELHFVTQHGFAPLLENLEHLTSVIGHVRRPAVRGLLAGARMTRRLGCAIALDLQGNWKSALVCALSGARARHGVRGALRRERLSGLLHNHPVAVDGVGHPAALALAVARQLAPDLEPLPPRLVATEAEIEAEAVALRGLGIDPGRPFRVLVLTDPADPRSWRSEALCREAANGDRPVVCLAGPAEQAVMGPPGVPVLRNGSRELRRLVGLGGLMARAGSIALGPDRGATHVLAACGAETVTLFGPQDPAWTAPVGSRVLVAAAGPACVPCRRRRCTHPEGPVCMDFASTEARQCRVVGADGRLETRLDRSR